MRTLSELVAQACIIFGISCPTAEAHKPIVLPTPTKVSQSLPLKARPYMDLIKKISKNPSREAALTEQESAWNVFAKKPLRKWTSTVYSFYR